MWPVLLFFLKNKKKVYMYIYIYIYIYFKWIINLLVDLYSKEFLELICLYTTKWFQILLFNTNNSIQNLFAHS